MKLICRSFSIISVVLPILTIGQTIDIKGGSSTFTYIQKDTIWMAADSKLLTNGNDDPKNPRTVLTLQNTLIV